MTAAASSPAAPVAAFSRPTSTIREDGVLLVGASVLLLGLFSDGWAHNNILEDLESFLSPYHAGIFLGFVLTAGWLGLVIERHRGDGRPRAAAIPLGYRPAVIGVALFAVGFVGDGAWHTAFGIEVDLEALLSPTHLLMFAGLLTMFTTPWRAAAARGASGGSWRERGTEVASVVATTLAVSFFLMFLWSPIRGFPTTPWTEWLAGDTFGQESGFVAALTQELWLGGSLVVTAVFVAAAVALVRRMPSLPRGALTVLTVVVGVAMSAMFEFGPVALLLMWPLAGGVADVVAARTEARPRARLLAVGVALSATMWAVHWAVVAVITSIGWAPELWAGQVVFAVLAGGAVALHALPPAAAPQRG